ncbi:MAG: hypothetical protein P4N59_17470 [Negativicutes bacterium]|nr:hypothetical protein [Negativicutes bacterium]
MVDQFRVVVHGYVNMAIRRYEARLKTDRGQTRARLRRPAEKESS